MYLGGKRRWMHLVVETQRRLSFSFSGGGGGGGGGLQVQIICQNVALLCKCILKLQIITNIASLLPKSFVPNRFQPEFQKAAKDG